MILKHSLANVDGPYPETYPEKSKQYFEVLASALRFIIKV